MYSLYLQETGELIAARVKVARSLLSRAIGLLGKRQLAADEGLWLSPCRSVHTHFMRFSIDIIFLDARQEIIALYRNLPPFRFTKYFSQAQSTLELSAGIIQRFKLKEGQQLEFKDYHFQSQPEGEG